MEPPYNDKTSYSVADARADHRHAKREMRPYFLWDEDVSIAELHQVLTGDDNPRRDQLLAKMLREARDIDVWQFVRPVEVARRRLRQ